MSELERRLRGAVATTVSFDAGDVARLVARRRRTRRTIGGVAASLVVLVGVGAALTLSGAEDDPDLEAVDDSPTTTASIAPEPVVAEEDPEGPDGNVGAMSDLHVETTDQFGFSACGAVELTLPTDARAAELEAVIEELRDGGLHEQRFVVSSAGPQSDGRVPSIGLSSNYEPTLQWIADRADPADVCVDFAEFGIRNLPPELAAVLIAPVDSGFTVVADGCSPKGEWVQPFVRRGEDLAELGIAIGRGQVNFLDDCELPTVHTFEEAGSLIGTLATTPGTIEFLGDSLEFRFDPVNAASPTIGDDLVAQHVDDPTVQFQVSDIFSDSPVAGLVGPVATDQWPVTGSGSIVLPDDVPAGTYSVHLIDAPELNGLLEVGAVDGVVSLPVTGVVAPGVQSDLHVEATDMVFPDCANPLDPVSATEVRNAELVALRDRLWADGLSDEGMFLSTSSVSGGRLQIGLYRRSVAMVDFLVERADVDDVCIWILPPVGAFTAPPGLMTWELDESSIDGPDDTSFSVVNASQCGLIYKELLLPVQVKEFDDRVEVGVPVAPRFGPSVLPCPARDVFEITLTEPIGDRVIVAAPGPTAVVTAPNNGGVPVGTPFEITFDLAGVGDEQTVGDDVMIQRVDDPSVQIQVTAVFTTVPRASDPETIVTDRWAPVADSNGAVRARLILPADARPGDYTFVFIEHPQINGLLAVASGSNCGQPDDGPISGWILPDQNNDCVVEVAGFDDGVIHLSGPSGYEPLRDSDGELVTVPTTGDESFVCGNEWGVVVRYVDPDGDGLVAPGDYLDLTVIDGVGAWVPSLADVVGDLPLPPNSDGCIGFARG